ncbi:MULTISPECIES: AMP-binding protein [Dickeya]|uniref:AMP-binding protein n=1 Tax=Dickeya TaxID=204037 RepID=UPI000319DB11|nr:MULTISPECIES: AMP-binding protein [Dickeya]AJC66808.1 FadD [Dickeya zeae EC1]
MFLNIEKHPVQSLVAVDENCNELSYGELVCNINAFSGKIKKRTLVFCFTENSIGSLFGYTAFLSNQVVPLLFNKNIESKFLDNLIDIYQPYYLWRPVSEWNDNYRVVFRLYNYELVETGFRNYEIHDELALLITTSGSTGSPKLVRQSYTNIISNASSISSYLNIDKTERALVNLPMYYVYGLSIINSHLLNGATLLLTTKGLMQKDFWEFVKEYQASSFSGVPYTYEMLKKIRFLNMELPYLKTMTQAGGKLSHELHKDFAEYAKKNGKQFFVMYGAAEATSRMGYLPPDVSLEKIGSIGISIPGGQFSIIDTNGIEITENNEIGELVYLGDNVTLGYAQSRLDLVKGNERNNRLETGDIARRDDDGYYYIVGRKTRFLKLFGNRINLDDIEGLIKEKFPGTECACNGIDDKVNVFVTEPEHIDAIKKMLSSSMKINHTAFSIKVIPEIPKNEAGKILYSKLDCNDD